MGDWSLQFDTWTIVAKPHQWRACVAAPVGPRDNNTMESKDPQ